MSRHKRSLHEDFEQQEENIQESVDYYSDEYTEIDTETLFDDNGNSTRQNEWIIAAVNEELSKMIAFTGTTASDTEFCVASEANEDVQNNNKTLVQSGIDNGIKRKAFSNENIEITGELSTIEAVKHDQSNVSDLPEFMDCGVRIIRRSQIGVGIGITKNCCAEKMALEKDLGMDNLKLVHANDATVFPHEEVPMDENCEPSRNAIILSESEDDSKAARQRVFVNSLFAHYKDNLDHVEHVLDVLASFEGDSAQTLHSMGMELFKESPTLLEHFFVAYPWARNPGIHENALNLNVTIAEMEQEGFGNLKETYEITEEIESWVPFVTVVTKDKCAESIKDLDRSVINEVIPRIKECDVRINRISKTDFGKMKNCCVKIKRLDKKFVAVLEYLDQVSLRRFSVQQSGGSDRSNKIVVLSQDNGGQEIQENTTSNFNQNSCNSNLFNTRLHKTSSSPHGISTDIEDNVESQEVREMVVGQNDLKDCDKSTDEEHAFNCDVSTPVDRETDENLQNCSFSTGTFYSARSNVSSSFTNDTYDSAMDETPFQSHFVSSDEEDIEKQIELIPKIKIKRKLIEGILEFTSEFISTRKRKAYDLMEFEKDAIIENDELIEPKHVPVGNSDSMSNTIKVDSSSAKDQVSTPGDTPSDKMIPQILTKRKSKQWRPYSKEEDDKILEYMRENEMSGRQRGRRSWQVMEQENVCPGRSWQSMKERWIKHIEQCCK